MIYLSPEFGGNRYAYYRLYFRVGHGLDLSVDWIGSDDCNPLFFFIYIFSLLTTDKRCRCNTIMCILADFNR